MAFLPSGRKPKVVGSADLCCFGAMKPSFRCLPLVFFCLVLTGCTSLGLRHRPAKTSAAPSPRVIGRVSLVNEELHFALIESAQTPETGTKLHTRSRDGRQTALLKVAQQKSPPFLIGDIVTGEPHVGDAVLQPRSPEQPASPPAPPAP